MHRRWIVVIIIGCLSTPLYAHTLGTPVAVGPAGSLPHYLMTMSEDHLGGLVRNTSAPLTEWVPDLAAFPTRVATNGRWSQIWGGSPPDENDVVLIPSGVTVTYDLPTASTVKTIGVQGSLIFDPVLDLQMKVGTIFVYPHGMFESMPIATRRHHIIFSGTVNPTEDPSEYGVGLVAVGGTVTIKGSTMRTPFAAYTRAQAGENTITLAQPPLDWKPGDELFLAGDIITRFSQYNGWLSSIVHGERVRIQSMSANIVTLTQPLQYTHSKRTDNIYFIHENQTPVSSRIYDRQPGMVAHLTRNVLLSSEQPLILKKRGHVLFTGDTTATVAYTQLEELGRTTNEVLEDVIRFKNGTAYAGPVYANASWCGTPFTAGRALGLPAGGQVVPYQNFCSLQPGQYVLKGVVNISGANQRGRYSLHAHHVTQPFLFDGNSIINTQMDMRWGITSHNSFGVVSNTSAVFLGGAAIVSEYGSEAGPFLHNFVIGLGGGSHKVDGDRLDSFYNRLSVYDWGHSGFGFWFGGHGIEVKNNFVDGLFFREGFDFYQLNYGRGGSQPITKPDSEPDFFPSVDGIAPALYGRIVNMNAPLRLFEGGVSYAHTENGNALSFEWDGSYPGSIVRNFTSYEGGVHMGGENAHITYDNIRIIGKKKSFDPSIAYDQAERTGTAIDAITLSTMTVTVLNSYIEQFDTFISQRGMRIHVENTTIVNINKTFIDTWYPEDFGAYDAWHYPGLVMRDVVFKNSSSTNAPPSITMISPNDGAFVNQQTPLLLKALATDSDGQVVKVEFFSNYSQQSHPMGWYEVQREPRGAKIGEAVFGADGWTVSWNPPPGHYFITARATDNQGGMAHIGTREIDVVPGLAATPVFYRGIDFVNGALELPAPIPRLVIKGNLWDTGNTSNFIYPDPSCAACIRGNVRMTPTIPPADENMSLMLRTKFDYNYISGGTYGNNTGFQMTQVPSGVYFVYVYTSEFWNNPRAFSFSVQDTIFEPWHSPPMSGASWERHGPFPAVVTDNTIRLRIYQEGRAGNAPHISGLEVYRLSDGGTLNQRPVVRAEITNITHTPTATTASLASIVTDDGISGQPLKAEWKLMTGPTASVYFTNKYATNSRAIFSQAGTYILQLFVDDGSAIGTSNFVTIDVPPLTAAQSSATLAQLTGATFFRGIDFNGPGGMIEGNQWEGTSSPNYQLLGNFSSGIPNPILFTTTPALIPAISNPALSAMLSNGVDYANINLTNIPPGRYQLYSYTPNLGGLAWGDIYLDYSLIDYYHHSDGPGAWRKRGPWTIEVSDGNLEMTSYGLDTSVSTAGIELWRLPNETETPRPRTLLINPEGPTAKNMSGRLEFRDRSSSTIISTLDFATNTTGHATFTIPSNVRAPIDLRIVIAGYLLQRIDNPDVTATTQLTFSAGQILAGDFNADSTVNTLDWSTMNRNWFSVHPLADVNKDGIVNAIDFSFLSKNWLVRGA